MVRSPLIGQTLQGAKDTYIVTKQLHKHVWSAKNTYNAQVVLKIAPPGRFHREKKILGQFKNHSHIRQLLDDGDDPPFMVLEHLGSDALRCSRDGNLSRPDIKLIALSTLSALKSLHAKGIAHTDVKPDNILLNFDTEASKVTTAKLADCGDAWDVGLDINVSGTRHVIGAAIFRSPEALIGLKWSTPTDIWSFGATLISLIWGKGFHMFKPPDVPADDEEFPVHVLIQQARYFGPFPLSYEQVLDEEQNHVLTAVHVHIEEQNLRKPFSLAQDEGVTQEDKDFIGKIMQLDPRDRPTAVELLEDPWFSLPKFGVCSLWKK